MPYRIVPAATHIDFIGKWRPCLAASLSLIALGIVATPWNLHWGIDFAGGWEVQVRFAEEVETEEGAIREALAERDLAELSVVRFGEESDYLLRFFEAGASAATSPPRVDDVFDVLEIGADPQTVEEEETELAEDSGEVESAPDETELAEGAGEVEAPAEEEGADPTGARTLGQTADRILNTLRDRIGACSLERVEFVGPRVGAELREAGILSLLIAGLLILIYIAFRFNMLFAPGAVIALFHDVLVTSSLLVLMGREFNLQVLAALLAIVGYSLNDTIIVYDRVRENMLLRTTVDFPEVLNRGINQTLSRTLLTSATTMLAVMALLLLGGEVIQPFAMTMAIGILVGTYSSVYVAAPVLLGLEKRYGAKPSRTR